jgi:hypothetical protein
VVAGAARDEVHGENREAAEEFHNVEIGSVVEVDVNDEEIFL